MGHFSLPSSFESKEKPDLSNFVLVLNTFLNDDNVSNNRRELTIRSLIASTKLDIKVLLVDGGSENSEFRGKLKSLQDISPGNITVQEGMPGTKWGRFPSYGDQIRYTAELALGLFPDPQTIFFRMEPEKLLLLNKEQLGKIVQVMKTYPDALFLSLMRNKPQSMPYSQLTTENDAASIINNAFEQIGIKKLNYFSKLFIGNPPEGLDRKLIRYINSLLSLKPGGPSFSEGYGNLFGPFASSIEGMKRIADLEKIEGTRDGNEILFALRAQILIESYRESIGKILYMPVDFTYDTIFELLPEIDDVIEMSKFENIHGNKKNWIEAFKKESPNNLAIKRVETRDEIIAAVLNQIKKSVPESKISDIVNPVDLRSYLKESLLHSSKTKSRTSRPAA